MNINQKHVRLGQNVTAFTQLGEYDQLLPFLPVSISAVDGKLL